MICSLRFTSGFPFAEVTLALALGIAAFYLIGIFGLIPVGVTTRNATSPTAVTNTSTVTFSVIVE
jgi:hypothetical protein